MPPPIRRVSTVLGRRTDPADRLPGDWRYSSQLALVLSGGGARAAYQVGILAGLAERLPGLEFPIVTGVSAGAMNAISLAAHRGPLAGAVAAMEAGWLGLTVDQVYRLRPMRFARSAAAWLTRAVGRRARPAVVRGLLDP
ncbi:MAG: patatin-like phospholipase family protein, partial [Acidimicrobiales bacterium]